MALSQRLDLRQTQALVMTPQLQQAIKLLQLSNLELATYLQSELEQNPLLEADTGDPETRDAATSGEEEADEPTAVSDREAPLDGSSPALDGEDVGLWREAQGQEGEGRIDYAGDPEAWAGRATGGDRPEGEGAAPQLSLRERLLAQLNLEIGDPAERLIGVHLADLLDEAGYLVGDLGAVAAALGTGIAEVEAVLQRLQRFDPPGIFARDLAECLALQLRERNRLDPAMQALLANLPMLAMHNVAGLMRVCGVDADDLAEMIAEIKALNPKPALALDLTTAPPIVPDIIMRPQQGGGWLIELNQETLPRLLVNKRYYATLRRTANQKVEKEYLAERLHSANWLVKSLHQRATTILKVATEIVHQQGAFFQFGVQYLKPLVLRDIATAISMHESTVSRVTSNKFIASPRGIFELKYFFSTSIQASAGGEAHSAEAVRFRIRALIDSESADDVLSDERIVDILQRDGIDIARRTVAKYRESLHIPSSLQRRREKAMKLVSLLGTGGGAA